MADKPDKPLTPKALQKRIATLEGRLHAQVTECAATSHELLSLRDQLREALAGASKNPPTQREPETVGMI